MSLGSMGLTEHYDLAFVTLYVFWGFFAGLIFYLLRENKREGYPLISEDRTGGRVTVRGWPEPPPPKQFLLDDGRVVTVPKPDNEPPLAAVPLAMHPGSPLIPTGDPMRDGVGPAAFALRDDEPERMWQSTAPRIVPMRVANDFHLDERDPDPRGMPVVAADGKVAGICRDVWVDKSECLLRYLEVEVETATGPRRVVVPWNLVTIDAGRGRVNVVSVLARHFESAPGVKNPDQITRLEEDRISAYFGGGHLFATPDRLGPVL
ncbi:MAG: photosynthetic reaction center subunit H [Acetobacteraceae bacterium]